MSTAQKRSLDVSQDEIILQAFQKHEGNWDKIVNDEEYKSLQCFLTDAKNIVQQMSYAFTKSFMEHLENKDTLQLEKDIKEIEHLTDTSFTVNITKTKPKKMENLNN